MCVITFSVNGRPVSLIIIMLMLNLSGNYRVQLYDKMREEYMPATQGLGMFVEVKDPDEKVNGL